MIMSEGLNKPVVTPRVCLFFALIGLLLMAVGNLIYMKNSPGLVREFRPSAGQLAADTEGAMVGALMQRVSEDPDDADALSLLGSFFLEKQDGPKAEIFLSRAVEADPAEAMFSYMLGLAQARSDKSLEAEANFLRAIELGGPLEVHLSLGILYFRFLNNRDKAMPIFQKLVENPDTPGDVREATQKELEALLSE
jgi:tetratricopeptide (TPR) repeat protein